ncbi:alanine/glycine:cation symporter family protein [Paenibacillus polygoni]|uniref:Alanine/glycine:cation symporter family protein n=1 Tax=Paenibacillus polygoni TaxID=3050112 RepID=A0ABY8XBD5_9BACL|nr:alanine/glycine:cation symporter family protein [Paenibacillus polygoni]WIV21294.1 alanine/glycine:cation symporter family protein [Paenibacillus polygoni]
MQDFLQKGISLINDVLWSYVLIILLVAIGLYFTWKSGFMQFTYIKDMFRELKGSNKKQKGEITAFQAFCISMAARVGTGNITGIALAIGIGGPGAVFWMWIIAIIGSASSFVESTLAQVYKIKDKQGFRGGPAYYMEQGLNKRWMGILFAVLITISFGLVFNAVQANTVATAFQNSFGVNPLWLGIALVVAFGIIIFGGIKRIAKISEYIVVIMAVIYIGIAFIAVLINITEVPAMIATIVKHAFGFEQFAGGTLGAALMQGVKRGLFSNEAGMGSAPNAAATATTSHPAKQGLIQALAVLIDTLVICTSTAFLVLLSGAYTDPSVNTEGIVLTQTALGIHFGDWASSLLAVMIFLFAFSTLIGNYYYGETNIEFIKSSKTTLVIYRIAVLAMIMFGSVASVKLVWDMADLFMGFMVIVNLIAIGLLSKIAFAALKDYSKQRKEGKDPVFYKDSIPGIENVTGWEESPKVKS